MIHTLQILDDLTINMYHEDGEYCCSAGPWITKEDLDLWANNVDLSKWLCGKNENPE